MTRSVPSESTAPSRRALIAGALGGLGAWLGSAIGRPHPAAAASVVLGGVNTASGATTIRSSEAASTAKALIGVVLHDGSGASTAGVQGQSHAVDGRGVLGIAMEGNGRGVSGRAANGRGVYGAATASSGVNYGVYGESSSAAGFGVYGTGNTGVYGDGVTYGVRGVGGTYGTYSDGGIYGARGVGGTYGAYLTGTSYGVYASAPSYAAWFNGKVHVTGDLEKPGGSFVIDHPMDPANRTLEHSFVEAPERLNVYRGNVTLDGAGRATVQLPGYFAALNVEYSYQLTPIGAPAPELNVAREIENNRFDIAGGAAGQKVCWQVTGARQDAWAKANPLRVDYAKDEQDRGRYLNPELFGKSLDASIHRVPVEDRPDMSPRPAP